MSKSQSIRRTISASRLILAIGIMTIAGVWSRCSAQEHPTSSASPPPSNQASPVTLPDVAAYLETYVKQNSANGLFPITDQTTHQRLALKLIDIHRDRLARVAPNTFFVCSDFQTADGKHTYDLDFFIHGDSKINLTVVTEKTSIHKKDGKPRYTWALNTHTGLWEQKPFAAKTITAKINEHPAQGQQ